MARARNSGGGGSVWGMVILGMLFFVCLVLSITFYVQLQGARELADEADAELNRFATEGLRNDPAVLDLLEARDPVVAQLLDHRTRLRGLIGENVDLDDLDDDEQLENVLDSALHARVTEAVAQHGSLSAAVTALRGDVAAREQRIDALEQERDTARQQLEQAQERLAELQNEYAQTEQQLRSQLEEVTGQFTGHVDATSASESELRELVEQARREQEQRVAELDDQITRLTGERDELRREIRELVRREDRVAPPDVVLPAGRIVSVIDAERRAQIDIGRRDRLVLGMTFEVFDRDEMVRYQPDRALRGKATVEVIGLQDEAAMTRIVRRAPNAELRPDDQVVNLVYDPHATYRFFVYGEFDIDRDGRATEAERQRVKQMIRDWGGEVADELRYDVDFVVLGAAPERPQDLPPGVVDPERIQRAREAQEIFERYQSLEEEALAYGIPVLNQNRFLTLVGHYRR